MPSRMLTYMLLNSSTYAYLLYLVRLVTWLHHSPSIISTSEVISVHTGDIISLVHVLISLCWRLGSLNFLLLERVFWVCYLAYTQNHFCR